MQHECKKANTALSWLSRVPIYISTWLISEFFCSSCPNFTRWGWVWAGWVLRLISSPPPPLLVLGDSSGQRTNQSVLYGNFETKLGLKIPFSFLLLFLKDRERCSCWPHNAMIFFFSLLPSISLSPPSLLILCSGRPGAQWRISREAVPHVEGREERPGDRGREETLTMTAKIVFADED